MRPVQVDGSSTGELPQLAGGAAPRRAGRAAAVLRLARPRQWVKNVLVFAAPAAAGVLTREHIAVRTVATAVIFVAASVATYVLNDVVDRERDRLHPVKANRPIASGLVPARLAVAIAGLLCVASIGCAAVIGRALVVVVVAYLASGTAYTLGLKRVPGVELLCVASGFVLRAVAGGAATGVYISNWFLTMTAFGALLVVVGKRCVEQQVLGEAGGAHRSTLSLYPPRLLRLVRRGALLFTIATYCLWVVARADSLSASRHATSLWFYISIGPFVLAVLLIETYIERGQGGEPEELALTNRLLQLIGLVWLAMLLLGVYG